MIQMSPTVSRANALLEECTERHLSNGMRLGLTFARPKMELLYCLPLNSKNKNKSLSSHPPLRILNTTISAKQQIKYLGVFIDESLTFIHHATMAATRGHKILGRLSFLHHRSHGIPAHITHHLAMTLILLAMFWASPAWWTDRPSVSAMLSVTYNGVGRWITSLPLNTRTTNLITLGHLPPMAAYLDYLSLRYAIRLILSQLTMPLVLRAASQIPIPTFWEYTICTTSANTSCRASSKIVHQRQHQQKNGKLKYIAFFTGEI